MYPHPTVPPNRHQYGHQIGTNMETKMGTNMETNMDTKYGHQIRTPIWRPT